MVTSCILAVVVSAFPNLDEQPEISFDIWDWTQPAQDLDTFRAWVQDLKQLGVTRIEMSVPWRLLEPEPHRYDLRWLADWLAVCEEAGIGMRLRINSYYAGATPAWYDGERWRDRDGNPAPQAPPSIADVQFWRHYGPLCTHIAELCRGRDVLYNAFIGIHAELKYADWWTFDDASLALWREAIEPPRPDWLREAAGDAPLPERPVVPSDTQGQPDRTPAHLAFIAFREHCWRDAVERFETAIRKGDPDARISAPLGESYRRQSAHMANLDYWGLTRGAVQVVHSYDFFWHAQDPAWMAAASVAAFQGITGLPAMFEFDGTESMSGLGYSVPHLLALGQQAARVGAGLKFANNSYTATLPSEQPLIRELIEVWRTAWRPPARTAEKDTVLLLFSKWANYVYRESSEWLHEAQFGVYKLFCDAGIPVRIINEDNLGEELDGYRAIYLAFSPRALLPLSALEQLEALPILILEDFAEIPETVPVKEGLTEGMAAIRVSNERCPAGAQDLSHLGANYQFGLQLGAQKMLAFRKNHVIMGYAVGSMYLNDNAPAEHQGLVLWALQQE